MRVAIIHYWLVGMRGGERVVEALLAIFPEADIITHVYNPQKISGLIARQRIITTFINRLPGAQRHYQAYLPLMPRALEQVDLSAYDLVIASESGPAKGVIVRPDAVYLCYCHTPMRYIYDHYAFYSRTLGPLKRIAFGHVAHRLRQWDYIGAQRLDAIAANSNFIARRIRRAWGREAVVIHPPVDIGAFNLGASSAERREAPYLVVSELVGYKRADIAIEAMRGRCSKLLVAGQGDDAAALRRNAPANVEFLGRVDFQTLKRLYATSRALLFPGEEDFGIVPVEAMASGCPVIAFGSGGVLDTVTDGLSGFLFPEQTVASLSAAMDRFEQVHLDAAETSASVAHFGTDRFINEFKAFVDSAVSTQQLARSRPAKRVVSQSTTKDRA